ASSADGRWAKSVAWRCRSGRRPSTRWSRTAEIFTGIEYRAGPGAGQPARRPARIMMGGMSAEWSRVFLLSPADCGGDRARLVLSSRATFDLAVRLRDSGVPLGEVMSFMSGLYFRGKLTYARAFARPPEAVLVITPNAGLVPADVIVGVPHLRKFARGDGDPDRPGYPRPLRAAPRLRAH